MNGDTLPYSEIAFSPEQLQNMPESASPWFDKRTEEDGEREAVVDEAAALIWKMADACLTPRQQAVVRLYYGELRTQEEIAAILGISQATVNHHLIGKMKQGKAVGGAMQKIRKAIRREAAKNGGPDIRRRRVVSALGDTLEGSTTRRHTARLFKNLLGLADGQPRRGTRASPVISG